jgi:ABC-type dipeptide/oligopeptide/nickel transport system ATPase component
MTVSIDKLLAGDPRSIARAITTVENGIDGAVELMKAVFPKTGKALVIGITGAPGAGKSSLVDKLALHYKDKGDRIGIMLAGRLVEQNTAEAIYRTPKHDYTKKLWASFPSLHGGVLL